MRQVMAPPSQLVPPQESRWEPPPPNFPDMDCLPQWLPRSSDAIGSSLPSPSTAKRRSTLRRHNTLPSLPPAPQSPRELLQWMEKVMERPSAQQLRPLDGKAPLEEVPEEEAAGPAVPREPAFSPKDSTREWMRRVEQEALERWQPPAEEDQPEGPLGLLTPRTLAELPKTELAPPPPRPAPPRKLPDLPGSSPAASGRSSRRPSPRPSTQGSPSGSRPVSRINAMSRSLSRNTQSRPTLRLTLEGTLLLDPQAAEEQEPEEALLVFKDLALDGDIPADRLLEALRRLGYRRPNEVWALEITARFEGRSHLDRPEFFEFVDAYAEKFRTLMRQKVLDVDKSGTGRVSASELPKLLRQEGVTTPPGLVEDLINEFPASERATANWIGVAQFIQMSNHAIDRFGFTRAQVEELSTIFSRYDRDEDGSLTSAELRAGLAWSGFREDVEATGKIRAAVGQRANAPMNKAEFFQFMQRLRDQLCEDIRSALAPGGSAKREELHGIVERLGFRAMTPEVISEALEDCQIAHKASFEHDDVFVALEKVREKEDLLHAQQAEAVAAFEKFARGGNDIGGLELMSAIRFLGYPQTMEQVQEILEDFDIDESNTLDREEFVKVIRHYRQDMMMSIRKSFRENDLDRDGSLSVKEVRRVFLKAGQVIPEKELTQMMQECTDQGKKLDLWSFAALMEKHRMQVRNKQRANQGFTDLEVRKYTRIFNRFDPDGVGEVSNRNLARLIEELFPGVREDHATHARAKAVLKEIDEDGDGQVDLREFLRMMRFVQDDADEKRMARDQEALKDARFTRVETKEFRQVFQMFDDDMSGDLSYDDVATMLSGIVPLGHRASKSLLAILKAVDRNGDRVIDFLEFLGLMRRLQDDDWNNINSHCASLADAAHEERLEDQERLAAGHANAQPAGKKAGA